MRWIVQTTLVVAIGGISGAAVAQPASTASGITVSPPFQQIVISKAVSTNTVVRLTNHTKSTQQLALSAVDFKSLDETGGVAFVGSTNSYGLANWMTLNQSSVTLTPGQTQAISATIHNRSDLAPGGHYGAILIKVVQSEAAKAVELQQVAASLLFTVKDGGAHYAVSLTSISGLSSLSMRLPTSMTLRMHNDGNVHSVPRGTVAITDPRGHLVKKGIVNVESAIILPDSYRRYSVDLQSVGRAWLPGRYTVTTSYRADNADALIYNITHITIIPLTGILLLIVMLAIIGVAILGGRKIMQKRRISPNLKIRLKK